MKENMNLPEESSPEISKEAKTAPKKEKKPNIFVRFFRWFPRFFREYRSEMKKVTWMSAADVRKNTFLVVVATVVVSVVVLGVDSLFNFIIQTLGSLY